jgi:SIR2-like domain
MSFPDLPHFEQIRQRLWYGREFGQAAVMVGAGFSRNAEKIALSTPDFPLWSDLASDIYDELYPQNQRKALTDEQSKANGKAKEKALANPLALASEYEVIFGSPALQDLLIRSIPDNQYNPGRLHKLLMSLPWSDVFTTNYDTLLERTRPFIHDRKYDLICTTADIPGRMKPRIVKLHGSFPSHRPFIITEEDYRTYPRKFAPFVNMVQQSIMESVFCLIGFSGEDPNFLNWIGWVRDNLGESTPPIYLCGLLDSLSESKKQILRRKNILTVDVSPIFPRSEYFDPSLRHSKSIEWLLLSLMNGKPPNITSWPESWNGSEWQKDTDLPELIPGSPALSELGEMWHQSDELSEASLRLLLKYLELNNSFSLEDTKNILNQLIQSLAYVILPKIAEMPEDCKIEVNALISDLEAAGICILPASIMTLFIEPENLKLVSLKLRTGLALTKQDEVEKAIESLFYWLAYSRKYSLPESPSDLLNELVNRVFVRRQPGLGSAIGWLANLIKEMPEILNAEQYDSVLLALEYLLKETELPSLQDLEMNIESNPLIRFEERPEYRRLASRLTHRLYLFYEKQGKELPAILVEWKNISEKDVLPEVRKVWQ